jgi:hypothetical protein
MKMKPTTNDDPFGWHLSAEDLRTLDVEEYRRSHPRLTPREKLDEYLTRAGLNPLDYESEKSARDALEEVQPNYSILLGFYEEKYEDLGWGDER